MEKRKRCRHCRKRIDVKRNPMQVYCSSKDCQNARKRKWQKTKIKNDPDHKANQQAAQRRWYTNHPHYWRDYRQK